MQKYVLRIHVAAPGTPLVAPDEPPGATSLPGHMYYSIVQGASTLSFGFAPITPGQISGPGKIYDNDVKNYMNPLYTRNLEITKEQYNFRRLARDPRSMGLTCTTKTRATTASISLGLH
jgi:hypothetical protein